MTDRVPSIFGTLLFLTRNFTLEGENKLGHQPDQFEEAVGLSM